MSQNPQPPIPIVQPQEERPRYQHRKLAIAVAVICLLVGSTTIVYAAFVLSGSVTGTIAPTQAQIQNITMEGSSVTLNCSPAFPTSDPVTCTIAAPTTPGHQYTLHVTVKNNGGITIPTVWAVINGVIIYPVVTLATTTLTTVSTATTTQSTSTSVTSLASNGTWVVDYQFTVPADAIAGGTITITIVVNG